MVPAPAPGQPSRVGTGPRESVGGMEGGDQLDRPRLARTLEGAALRAPACVRGTSPLSCATQARVDRAGWRAGDCHEEQLLSQTRDPG